jgi:CDP-diacylglycerol--glycerol-3-phosphate 3-phosphatidyltransferase
MTNKNINIPNALSISRIIFLPILFLFVYLDMRLAFLIAFIILGSTDFFDGLVAKKFNQQTLLGQKLDSIADIFFYLSQAYFLYTLYPSYLTPNIVLLIIFFILLITTFITSSILFKRPVMMHTTLLRIVGVLVYAVIILSYFINTTYFVTGLIIFAYIAYIEEMMIFIKHGDVDADTKSYFSIK